jgi:hypothetical protein
VSLLTTIIAPEAGRIETPGGMEIFSIQIQSRRGWRRIGLDTDSGNLRGRSEMSSGREQNLNTPTITEDSKGFGFPKAIGPAIAIWFGGMAVLALIIDAPAVTVFGPRQNILAAVQGSDARLLSIGVGFVTARADQAGLARKLYSRGAWFVWPVLATGCQSGVQTKRADIQIRL